MSNPTKTLCQHLADTVPFRCCECGGQLVVVENIASSRYWCMGCHAWHTPEAVREHMKKGIGKR